MRIILLTTLFLFSAQLLSGTLIKGTVNCAETGEELIGATLVWKGNPGKGTVTGLDGSFSIENIASDILVFSYMGYETHEYAVKSANSKLAISLNPASQEIDEIVTTSNIRNTESSARLFERNSTAVVNAVSARSIEISPDLTVANVIQRMSGVTMERSSTGDGQYALLRGMDKRFNYTLVNGVKIPSPDNKNRFVPLDIFPSELLDRLEVTKSLTADMEGDGIGGAVNLVMKDAPSQWQFNTNVSTGFNTQFFSRNFQQFNHSAIDRQSPNTKYGLGYPFKISDFTIKNLRVTEKNALPMNVAGGFSVGGRVFKNHLGIMVAASYSDTYRGSTSDLYEIPGSDGMQPIVHRYYSTQQKRAGAHAKFDVRLNRNHKLMWYNAYMDFQNIQVRDAVEKDKQTFRMRWNHQSILSSTLKGTHNFWSEKLKFDWSFAYGNAFNETPDNATIQLRGGRDGRLYADPITVARRRWEENSDEDKAVYANLTYLTQAGVVKMEWSAGGMYRDKQRGSSFQEYQFRPNSSTTQYKGIDWDYFDEIKMEAYSATLNDPLNYDASEKIGAGYAQVKTSYKKIQMTAGLRVEHTRQGYDLKFPILDTDVLPFGLQDYYDALPSFHVRYELNRNSNMRFSYARAINRPSFFEIVPYARIFEDYNELGNPNLRHTIADNIDLRYEYFPRQSEQIMMGVFYKYIKDPIEYGMVSKGQESYYMPENFGNAYNAGVEVDITKYFNKFGAKANYTFTNSRITTLKWLLMPNPDPNAPDKTIITEVNQTRPLFGQAAHVANLSLLYKDMKNGWDAQIAFSYTGKRLANISKYIDEDWWQAGNLRIDASVEKSFSNIGLAVFAKASNLLNTPMYQYINPNPADDRIENIARKNGGRLERKEYYGQNFMIGLKYKL